MVAKPDQKKKPAPPRERAGSLFLYESPASISLLKTGATRINFSCCAAALPSRRRKAHCTFSRPARAPASLLHNKTGDSRCLSGQTTQPDSCAWPLSSLSLYKKDKASRGVRLSGDTPSRALRRAELSPREKILLSDGSRILVCSSGLRCPRSLFDRCGF